MRFTLFFLIFCFGYSSAQIIQTQPQPSQISTTGFQVSWTNSQAANSSLKYGTTPNFELGTLDAGNSINPSVQISGGSPAQVYYVQAVAQVGSATSLSDTIVCMTASLSSGLMKAYFNRSVNTEYASNSENFAISLPNSIDDTLIAYINRAQHSIDLMVYNLSEGNIQMSDIVAALNFAYNNGRSVRIIYNEDTGNTGIPDLNPNIPRLESPVPIFPQFGIMHNKIFIFDAFSSNPNRPTVWTGSTNLTPDQINIDPNNVIIIQDQSLAKAFTMEFEEMWGSNGLTPNPNNARFGPQKRDNTPHIFNIGGKRVECYFSPSDGVNKRIIAAIGEATHDVNVNTMLITRNDIRDALILGNINGKQTLVLVDDPSSSSTYSNLVASLTWRVMNYEAIDGSGTLHHKAMMADVFGGTNTFVLTGSHNWSSSAEDRNDENTLIIYDENIANQYLQEFMGRLGAIASNENLEDIQLRIFPNPSFGVLEIRSEDSNPILDIELINGQGAVVKKVFLQSQIAASLDLTSLNGGVYFVRIVTERGTKIEKIVLK